MPASDTTDNIRRAVIIIADFVNSAEVSNNLGVLMYDNTIDEFQRITLEVKDAVLTPRRLASGTEVEFSAQGDEVCVLAHTPESYSPDFYGSRTHRNIVWNALSFAIYLKLRWLLSEYNLSRVKDDLLPRNVSVGIHEGLIVYRPHAARNPPTPTSEGYAIAVTKRIETSSRERDSSGIVVSDAVASVCDDGGYRVLDFGKARRPEALKGITTAPMVRDVEGVPYIGEPLLAEAMNSILSRTDFEGGVAQLYEAARRNQSDRWLCSCVAHLLHLRQVPGSSSVSERIVRLVGPRSALVLLRRAAEELSAAGDSVDTSGKEELLERARKVLMGLGDMEKNLPWTVKLDIAMQQQAGNEGEAQKLLRVFREQASWE